MANLTGIVKQLKQERNRVAEQLSGLNAALAALSGPNGTRRGGTLSAAARAKIAAAQRKRWAKVKAAKKRS
jgi:hypothetical protein